MFIDHHDQQNVLQKTRNLELCFRVGTYVGTDETKFEKNSISQAIRRSLVSAIRFEANKINRRREERPIGSRAVNMLRDLARPVAARALSRAARGGGERTRRSESTYAQLVDMMSRIVARNRLRDGSIENATSQRGTNRAKLNAWRGRSLSFSRFSSVSRVTVTSNEANKSAMRCAKWTITARRAVLRLVQMKYRYFVPECCKQNAIFSVTSYHNRSYLVNVSTNR